MSENLMLPHEKQKFYEILCLDNNGINKWRITDNTPMTAIGYGIHYHPVNYYWTSTSNTIQIRK